MGSGNTSYSLFINILCILVVRIFRDIPNNYCPGKNRRFVRGYGYDLSRIRDQGPYHIHRWISDMLEELTIDTRSESMRYVFAANSNSSLQMQKAGMKLMTLG